MKAKYATRDLSPANFIFQLGDNSSAGQSCGRISPMKESLVNFFHLIRWNHAIEHGAIHILSRMMPYVSIAGRSNNRGFYIYGNVPTESLRAAVQEAINRIQGGERQLAIHPNCGTNMVSSAVLAAGGTMLATTGAKRRGLSEQIPAGVLGALMGVVLGQVIGLRIQAKITTGVDFTNAQIVEIQRKRMGKRVYHWVGIAYDRPPILSGG